MQAGSVQGDGSVPDKEQEKEEGGIGVRLKKDVYRKLMIDNGLTNAVLVANTVLSKNEVEWALAGKQVSVDLLEALAKAVGLKVSDIAYEDENMENENVIEFFTNADTATVTFHQGRYKNRIRKLAEDKPDEVTILSDENGFLVAKIPVKWIRIGVPRTVNMTDDQKAELAERLANSRK